MMIAVLATARREKIIPGSGHVQDAVRTPPTAYLLRQKATGQFIAKNVTSPKKRILEGKNSLTKISPLDKLGAIF